MAVSIVSDLHIHSDQDPLYDGLLRLISTCSGGDTLVLAGDVFDLFVGNKRVFRDRYARFFEALRAAGARGVRTHYIEGNHDFHLKRAFAGVPGFELHSTSVEFSDGGRRFYVAHGDLVDPSDFGYRALRALFRSLPIQALAAALPGTAVDAIGRASSSYSRDQKPALPSELPLERREKLRKTYRSFAAERLSHGFDFVVLGHCHDLDEMSFTCDGRMGQYINVGFPRVHGSYLSWSPGEEKIQREKL